MSIKEDENFAKALEAFYRKRGYSDLERVRAALEAYFPRAIAEAVTAERERCAKVCDGKISGTFPDIQNPTDADHRQIAWDACCEELAEAIRSDAK
ncbi:hypothetical protein [Gluconobacter albidus]|uniref:hypothetical protein n=1 Tax=Gluconobacter albidus TaxID=318683 RepID=UPI00309B5D9C